MLLITDMNVRRFMLSVIEKVHRDYYAVKHRNNSHFQDSLLCTSQLYSPAECFSNFSNKHFSNKPPLNPRRAGVSFLSYDFELEGEK